MAVDFIPPEFFGLSGIGKGLGRIGDQRREDRSTRRREARQDIADNLAIEEAAIKRYQTLTEMGINMPGDQGLAIRQQAQDGLKSAGIVELDARLQLSAEDINANADTLAMATPAEVRTDEQWIRIGNRLGLEPGFTPATAREWVTDSLARNGYDLQTLRDSAEKLQEYKDFLKSQGKTPGQIDAQIAIEGLADLRAGTTLRESQAELAAAQTTLTEARAKALLGEGASAIASTRLKLLEPFFKTMAEHGVDARVAYKLSNAQELTVEEEKSITDALAAAARSASDINDKMKVLADLLKIQHLGEGTHALAIVGIASEMFGADVVTATPKKGFFGGEKEGFEINVNLPLAISRMMSESGNAGESQQSMEDAMADMQKEVDSIKTKEELDVAVAQVESIEGFTLMPVFMQMIQERAKELEGGTAETTGRQPGDVEEDISSFTEEETIREEQKLRQELIEADTTSNQEEVSRIRGRLLELERHRQSNFETFGLGSLKDRFTTPGVPVPANQQQIRGR